MNMDVSSQRTLLPMPTLFLFVVTAALVFPAAPAMGAPSGGEELLRLDFDGPGQAVAGWQAGGRGKIRAEGVHSAPAGSGRHLLVHADPGTTVQTVSIPLPQLARCAAFTFRVRAAAATPAEPAILEAQFYTPQDGWLWRKVTLADGAWRTVEVPLRWLRWSGRHVPRIEEVDRFGFWFRTGGTYELDDLRFVAGGDGAASLSEAELVAVAFGPAATVRRFERRPFVVLTDAPDLAGEAVLEALLRMAAAVRRDLPELELPTDPVRLLVFAEDAAYRAFWPRFATRLAADVRPPRSDGFTMMGIASSSVGDASVRPVYVHEAAHALLEPMLRLSNASEWLHESLAVRYQVEFMGGGLEPALRNAVARDRLPSLADLTDGKPIAQRDYAFAGSFVSWLLAEPLRAAGLQDALGAMRARGHTALAPVVEESLGAPLAELEHAWHAWIVERHGAPPASGE